MVSTRAKLRFAYNSVKVAFFLKILEILTLISPRCGNWFKRVFFIITLYNDMQKNSIYQDLTLSQVNSRLLQFQKMELEQPNIALHIKAINYVKFDWTSVKNINVDVPNLTNEEVAEISRILVDQTPASLNYGENAMRLDITKMFNKGVLH